MFNWRQFIKNLIDNNTSEQDKILTKAKETLKNTQEDLDKAKQNTKRLLEAKDFFKKATEGLNKVIQKKTIHVTEEEFFSVYHEACLTFIEPNKTYYFKLRNHSDFLSAMYRKCMENVRYFDHEFFKLDDKDQFIFTPLEAFVAASVITVVNRVGKERFLKQDHQNLYNEMLKNFKLKK